MRLSERTCGTPIVTTDFEFDGIDAAEIMRLIADLLSK